MTKKVVFITAAAGAMGKSQAKLFAKNNYKVFLTFDNGIKGVVDLESFLFRENYAII